VALVFLYNNYIAFPAIYLDFKGQSLYIFIISLYFLSLHKLTS